MAYGIKAGMNTGDFSLSFEPNPEKQEQSVGYQGGIFLQLSNKTRTSLILEATYQTLQSMYRSTALPDFYGNTRSLSVDYSQLQIPLLLRYTAGNGVIRPFVNGGFLYSKNLKNRSVEINDSKTMPSNNTRRAIVTSQNAGYGLAAGVGAVIKRNSLPELSLEVRYDRMRYGNYVYYTPQYTALRFDIGLAF
ncbi:hypothetical protein GCM10011378_25710 [Hymenobacter glacieicola]|uniref:Outer membrane protein beta-barrel domain-containing protein n=2 Tax=Hymenobacter glacieicola TaxID=1562124 RepID=A0ABQ1WWR4_9BACT|nr:hypothetical protein GCM10011378_25710 [Hymenobacter glacieicola]